MNDETVIAANIVHEAQKAVYNEKPIVAENIKVLEAAKTYQEQVTNTLDDGTKALAAIRKHDVSEYMENVNIFKNAVNNKKDALNKLRTAFVNKLIAALH